jgi:hypothetical protein
MVSKLVAWMVVKKAASSELSSAGPKAACSVASWVDSMGDAAAVK